MSIAIYPLSIIAAVIPTLFFALLIYNFDHYEQEPLWLLSAVFLWGAIPSILAAFLFNSLFSLAPFWLLGPEAGLVVGASIVAPIVEESVKGLALVGILVIWRHELDSPLDGIIYGAMVGLGFAMIENVYYFLTIFSEGGLSAWGINILLRSIIFGLNHALFTSLTGLGIAIGHLSTRRTTRLIAPIAGWSAAILLHLIHNLSVVFGGPLILVTFANAWGGLLMMMIIIILALLQERRWIKIYLAEEIDLGTLTPHQYRNAYSPFHALYHRLDLLTTRGLTAFLNARRFYRRCSELAYKKHHFAIFQKYDPKFSPESIRSEVSNLSKLIA